MCREIRRNGPVVGIVYLYHEWEVHVKKRLPLALISLKAHFIFWIPKYNIILYVALGLDL